MAKSYRELTVWQRSIDLAEATYRITQRFPREEMYGLTSQMRRASVSIASNIAEGSGRNSRPDFLRFVLMARGSNDELQTQIIIAQRLGFGDPGELEAALTHSFEVGRRLSGLSKYLRSQMQ